MEETEEKVYRYDAFISYRHTEPDKIIAEKLHRMLETYKIPLKTKDQTAHKWIGRVFRDKDELPTSSNLSDNISEALALSKYLIVICSPRIPQSQWVIKEIETFTMMHGPDKVLTLLIEGEPAESFPDQLRYVTQIITHEDGTVAEHVVEVEPLAADIRGKDTKAMVKLLKGELMRLLAPMLGCKYDDLRQRHRERWIKKTITLSICISLIFASFGIYSGWQAWLLKTQVDKTLYGQSLFGAEISKQLLSEGDRRGAILLALEALPKNLNKPERPFVSDAEFALGDALGVYKFSNGFMNDIVLSHKNAVRDIVLNEEGTKVITACNDGYAYVWNVDDGQQLLKLEHGSNFVSENSIFFAENDSIIVSIVEDGVCAWDSVTGQKLWNVKGSTTCIALSKDGKKVAFGNDKLTVCDVKTGKLKGYNNSTGDTDLGIVALEFNQDGTKLGVGTLKGYGVVFDVLSGNKLYQVESSFEYIKQVTFSSDNLKLAIASNDLNLDNPLFDQGKGVIEIYNAQNGTLIHTHQAAGASISQAVFSPVDSNVIIFSEGPELNVLDIDSKELVHTFVHGDIISSFYSNGDGSLMITSSHDGTIRFCSLTEGAEIDWWRITQPYDILKFDFRNGVIATAAWGADAKAGYLLKLIDAPNQMKFKDQSMGMKEGSFSNDGKKVISFVNDTGEVSIWGVEKEALNGNLADSADPILDAFFCAGDQSVMTISKEGFIKQWNAETLQLKSELKVDSISALTLSEDKQFLVAQHLSGEITVTDTISNKIISTIDQDTYAESIFISPEANAVLTIDYDGSAALYNIGNGKRLHLFDSVKANAGAFSKDGKTLAISDLKRVRLLDLSNYIEIGAVEGFGITVGSLFFSPDGERLLIGLDDQSIHVYDLKMAKISHRLLGLKSNLAQCTFVENTQTLITQGENHEVVLWDTRNYKRKAELQEFLDISQDGSRILTSYMSDIRIIPYYSVEMLKAEAQKILKSRALTDEEKAKYFMMESN